MPDTTNTKALYAALRDDPCDWQRWMVLADAAEEIEMAATADVFRDCGYLMRKIMVGSRDALDTLVERYPHRAAIIFRAFEERKLNALPENVWIAVQQLAAERDEENFANRHIVGLPLWTDVGHYRDYLTPEMIRFAATVGREPGAYVVQQSHALYWLAARRTDGRIQTAIVGNYSGRGNALAWADAWKEEE